jgi:hypothetical protein
MGCQIKIKVAALYTHRYECPGVKIPQNQTQKLAVSSTKPNSCRKLPGLHCVHPLGAPNNKHQRDADKEQITCNELVKVRTLLYDDPAA